MGTTYTQSNHHPYGFATTSSEKAMDERRDQHATLLSNCGYNYLGAPPVLRRAIDRIIELEGGAA